MKGYNIILLIGVLMFCWSCQQSVDPIDLVHYVKATKNGLAKAKEIGDIRVNLLYKPLDFVIANEFRSNQIKQDDYDSRKEELKGLQYYNLQVSVPNHPKLNITNYRVANAEEQQQRLYYLSFYMKNDIRLIQGQDTLAPVLYHFERSYDMAGHRTFVLAFIENQSEDKTPIDRTLVIDSPIMGTGPIKLKIKEEDLKNIPTLKLI